MFSGAVNKYNQQQRQSSAATAALLNKPSSQQQQQQQQQQQLPTITNKNSARASVVPMGTRTPRVESRKPLQKPMNAFKKTIEVGSVIRPSSASALNASSNKNFKSAVGEQGGLVSALKKSTGFENHNIPIKESIGGSSPPSLTPLDQLHQAVFFEEGDFEDDFALDFNEGEAKHVSSKSETTKETTPVPARAAAAAAGSVLTKQRTKLTTMPNVVDGDDDKAIPWSSSPVRETTTNPKRLIVKVEEVTIQPAKRKRTLPWKKNEERAASLYSMSNNTSWQRPTATPAKSKAFPLNLTASTVKAAKKELKGKQIEKKGIVIGKVDEDESSKRQKLVDEVVLSREQKNVLEMVINEGKSVFFTGSAGTGKSVLMREIIQQLRIKYYKEPERVAVTASTGLAALNIGGVTLHSFAGIGLGRESPDILVKKIKKAMKSKNRWMKVKVLIIDEVSMVDGELFDKLEAVARLVRRNPRPFGGIQLVITGDFFQLPPVPDHHSSQYQRFSFESNTWESCVAETVLLTQIFRQKDPEFAKMLNDMRVGKISPATVTNFKSLSREVVYEDGLQATELFPTRKEVDNANFSRLTKLPGETRTFITQDTIGPNMHKQVAEKLLANLMAPEKLELKINAQVMLIKNMDESLVNGSLGRVIGFMTKEKFEMVHEDLRNASLAPDDIDDPMRASVWNSVKLGEPNKADTTEVYPVVQFRIHDGTQRIHVVPRETWKIESPTQELQASRSQLPLILSWAISIHKSQGQTLERVKVDLGKIFEKGQAYVALSRAVSKESLQVLRFDPSRVMSHDRVHSFYRGLKSAIPPPPEQVAVDFDDDEEAELMMRQYEHNLGNSNRRKDRA